jgi:hypothetical protein
MNYYLIKYINQLWSVEKQFIQLASAEAYKELLNNRNQSNCQYTIVVCPHIEGNKHLDKLIDYQLSKLNLQITA